VATRSAVAGRSGEVAPSSRVRGESGVRGEWGLCSVPDAPGGVLMGKSVPGRGEAARGERTAGVRLGVRPRGDGTAHAGGIDAESAGLDVTEDNVEELKARSESSSISVSRRARSRMAAVRISRSRAMRWLRPEFSLCSRDSSCFRVSLPRTWVSHSVR